MPPNSAKAPHFSRICLRVRDPGRSAAFYRIILGLTSLQDTVDDGGNAITVEESRDTPSGFEVVFAEGLPPGDHLTGLDRISFEVPSRESVDQIYSVARQHHARATHPRLYEGHWQTFIFDPDGYRVEIFSRGRNGVVRTSGDQE